MADLKIDDVVKVYNETGNDGSMVIENAGLQCRRISYENIFSEKLTLNNIDNKYPELSIETTK